MSEESKKNMELHSISSSKFAEQLKRANRRARTTQNYLVCKAAVIDRREELYKIQREDGDTRRIKRIIETLESSLSAHKSALDSLKDDH